MALPTEHLDNYFTALYIRLVWALLGLTGQGVTVGIIDDGFSFDQVLHSLQAENRDFRDGDNDPTAESGDGHGIKVANVLVAQADGTAAVGVAYLAGYICGRIGYGSNGSMGQNIEAIDYMIDHCDVINCSWGYSSAFADDFLLFYNAEGKRVLQRATTEGRGGKGAIIVFSAGNDGAKGQNVNYHNFTNSPHTIAVAAVNDSGLHPSWSTPGYGILISAPGVGIDWAGSGTSFSAPIISGIIALMLEANPNLTCWDVQEILARTAIHNDPGRAGWLLNGAGLWYHPLYGFGIADAYAACLAARDWVSLDYHEVTISGNNFADIPNDIYVQSVSVIGNVTSHSVLTSPAGTSADLTAQIPAGYAPDRFEYCSQAHRGEKARGRWFFPGQFTMTIRGSVVNPPVVNKRPYLTQKLETTMPNTKAISLPAVIDFNQNFKDDDAGDSLGFGVTQEDGSPLADIGLDWDGDTNTLSGTPTVASATLKVTATDRGGLTVDALWPVTFAENSAPYVDKPLEPATIFFTPGA